MSDGTIQFPVPAGDEVTEWTPTPWVVEAGRNAAVFGTVGGRHMVKVANCVPTGMENSEGHHTAGANARRIVECVNACRGIDTPAAIPALISAFAAYMEGKRGAGDEVRNALLALGVRP